MFESCARDFSDFGAQVFAFDVLEALNRKGGDLITPGISDGYNRRKQSKKKRGRKNKYYRQIDQDMMKKPTRSVMSLTMMGSTMSKRKMMNLMRMREGRDLRKRELPSKP
jgi:hypothetical protein